MNTGYHLKIGFDVAQTCETRAGCAWYADALIRSLVATAPSNDYFLYHRFGRQKPARPERGTRIDAPSVHHPFLGTTPQEAAAAWKAVEKGKAQLPGEPDIVQSNSFQAPATGKARLVVVIHDISFWAHPEFTTETNRLACQRGICEALRRADGLLFVSHFSRAEFDRMLPGWLAENQTPNVVTWEASRIEAPPLPLPPSTRATAYWLTIGSIEPRKNFDALLAAMELYWPRSRRRYPLHIAGSGGWRNRRTLAKIAAMEKARLVRRLGYVPDEALPGLYQGACALLFPSWYEGFGLPVLEAMQCGSLVICSNNTSLKEIGGAAPSYIDPANPASICEAMLRLEETSTPRRLGLIAAGRRQAARFSWSATARATLDFYEQVLTRPRKRALEKGTPS